MRAGTSCPNFCHTWAESLATPMESKPSERIESLGSKFLAVTMRSTSKAHIEVHGSRLMLWILTALNQFCTCGNLTWQKPSTLFAVAAAGRLGALYVRFLARGEAPICGNGSSGL